MKKNIQVIGIDHGWSNMKTASHIFTTGVKEITTEPGFYDDVVELDGKYYKVGGKRLEVRDTKVENDNACKKRKEPIEKSPLEWNLGLIQEDFLFYWSFSAKTGRILQGVWISHFMFVIIQGHRNNITIYILIWFFYAERRKKVYCSECKFNICKRRKNHETQKNYRFSECGNNYGCE